MYVGSGWGADSWHLMIDSRRALFYDLPVQVAPHNFGQAKLGGPQWEGQVGWEYTFGGCPSNMLDCYFLKTSPCPPIQVDPYDILIHNKSRVKAWNTPGIRFVGKNCFVVEVVVVVVDDLFSILF